MEILVENLQKKIPLNHQQIQKIVKVLLRHEKITQAVINVVFVSRQRIKSLNKKFLGREYTTDVLAFDMQDDDEVLLKKKQTLSLDQLMGDIFISTDAVCKNAKQFQTEESRELILYVIHGLLHLLGYDDHSSKDILVMRKKEEEWMGIVESYVGTVIKI